MNETGRGSSIIFKENTSIVKSNQIFTLLISSSKPKPFSNQSTTAITITAFRIFLIVDCMGI